MRQAMSADSWEGLNVKCRNHVLAAFVRCAERRLLTGNVTDLTGGGRVHDEAIVAGRERLNGPYHQRTQIGARDRHSRRHLNNDGGRRGGRGVFEMAAVS